MLLLKRFFNAILVLLGVVVIVFILFQLLGDPVQQIAGQSADIKTIENIQKSLHLDQPKYKQLLLLINDVSPFSIYDASALTEKEIHGFFIGTKKKIGIKLPYFGKSYQSKKDVGAILYSALPATFILAFSAMLLASIIGIFLGVIAAVYKGTKIDTISMVISNIGISAPSFFMAILISYFFGIVLHQYTHLDCIGSLYDIDEVTGEKYMVIHHLILPAVTLGIRPLSIIFQLTRAAMLDVLSKDYIRTAYAKGLSKTKVVFHHALINAISPVLISITGWFAELLAGSFFVEYIFGWNGIGKITVDALGKLDYPVVIGAVMLSAFIFVCIQFLSDYLIRKFNPMV